MPRRRKRKAPPPWPALSRPARITPLDLWIEGKLPKGAVVERAIRHQPRCRSFAGWDCDCEVMVAIKTRGS